MLVKFPAMLSPEIMRRLSQIGREPPVQRLGATTLVTKFVANKPLRGQSLCASSMLPVGREVANSAGKHWLVEKKLTEIVPHVPQRIAPQPCADETSDLHPDLGSLAASFPSQTLIVDLETCGFAGSMVFLVGVLHEASGELVIHQLLARSYAEERAVFASFWELTVGRRVLVTFNGKSFDWPVVRDRSILHRLQATEFPATHCDLLHHARRAWKDRLPNCKLQTLERFVCGRNRVGDIPGSEIPAVYHDFVRTADAWLIRSILHHNALDLITSLELSLRLMRGKNATLQKKRLSATW